MREMILSEVGHEREQAIFKLLPFQKEDFKGILRAMAGLPVTIRLLDPPLHEFVPHEERLVRELAVSMGKNLEAVKARIEKLHELNPMLGHRGCRLGITYPGDHPDAGDAPSSRRPPSCCEEGRRPPRDHDPAGRHACRS